MADLNLEQLLSLSKARVFLDLSKLFPARILSYLLAFLPGLFFEVSILLSNPEFVARYIEHVNAQPIPAVSRYLVVAIFLALTFILGYGFLLIDALIQYFFGYIYSLAKICWQSLCRRPLAPLFSWLLKRPFGRNHRWVYRLYRYAMDRGYFGSGQWQDTWRLWTRCARRLVQVRYGIDPADLEGDDWGILYNVLTFPSPEGTGGDSLLIALHATGWAGLCATRFAPHLVNEYFLVFCLFLVFNGLLHMYYVAKRRFDPRITAILSIRAALSALREHSGKKTGPE